MNHNEKPQWRADASKYQISTSDVADCTHGLAPDELLRRPLDVPYGFKEWDERFAGLLKLLQQEDSHIQDRAIRRLCNSLKKEQYQRFFHNDDVNTKTAEDHFSRICRAILTQTALTPILFERFCYGFRFLAQESPFQALILEWLKDLSALENIESPTQKSILAARIYLGAYDLSWQQVGNKLLELLDHADNTVRACAAHQIGKFYGRAINENQELLDWGWDEQNDKVENESVVGVFPLDMLLQLIRDKEIDRPGIAGAFWGVIPKQGIDAKEWLLDILEHSLEPEPYCLYFPCNLAFDAHERFSQDAEAIRRLIDMGRSDIAILAATEEDYPIPALKPLLIELGDSDDSTICRVASWNLAYHYHYLHPKGEAQKYVELVKLAEIHLFLLLSQLPKLESPYAVMIYPSSGEYMSREDARTWVDRVFPEEVKGPMRNDLWLDEEEQWFQGGYIHYYLSSAHGNVDFVDRVIIGYRSDLPWNPKHFLEL